MCTTIFFSGYLWTPAKSGPSAGLGLGRGRLAIFFYRTSAAKSHLNSCSHFWSRRPRANGRATPGATPAATPGATPGPPWGKACGKHFTKNAPKPQKVASRAGETPTCENEIVSGVGPNSFPKWGPQFLATLPSFLTTCPHINSILENVHGDIF